MNSVQAENLARALELDDGYSDDICPGCMQDISGWQNYVYHYEPGVVLAYRRRRPGHDEWPFTNGITSATRKPCVWELDYLLARRFRRNYIAQYSGVAA